jgi:uncharacterized protein (TIGR00661 family)
MANIFISLSGDGRGHATRMKAVVEALRPDHSITIFTSGQAFMLLTGAYRHTEVRVRRIGCLRFAYDKRGQMHTWKTAMGGLRYLRRLPNLLSLLRTTIEREQPDLVITDFEPALPRAARQAGVPVISLNHQHFLLAYDLGSLPLWLRWHASYMGCVVRAYDAKPTARIVSSFYFPPLRRGCDDVTQVGVLLRPEIEKAETSRCGHLVAYWRRFAPKGTLEALARCGREVHVYGMGERPPMDRVSFHAVEEDRFVEALASCDALVCTAGNQLVGEAIYLRKPVLAIPEAGNYEQFINAHFVRQMNAGEDLTPGGMNLKRLNRFLDRLGSFRSSVPPERMNGLPHSLAVLQRHLQTAPAASSGHPQVTGRRPGRERSHSCLPMAAPEWRDGSSVYPAESSRASMMLGSCIGTMNRDASAAQTGPAAAGPTCARRLLFPGGRERCPAQARP